MVKLIYIALLLVSCTFSLRLNKLKVASKQSKNLISCYLYLFYFSPVINENIIVLRLWLHKNFEAYFDYNYFYFLLVFV